MPLNFPPQKTKSKIPPFSRFLWGGFPNGRTSVVHQMTRLERSQAHRYSFLVHEFRASKVTWDGDCTESRHTIYVVNGILLGKILAHPRAWRFLREWRGFCRASRPSGTHARLAATNVGWSTLDSVACYSLLGVRSMDGEFPWFEIQCCGCTWGWGYWPLLSSMGNSGTFKLNCMTRHTYILSIH